MKDNTKLEIIIAEHAGFCFGVKRATELAESALPKHKTIHTLGELIHNPQEVQRLQKEGIMVANELDEVSDGALIIRAHGVTPDTIAKAKDKSLNVIDATCPFVVKVQKKASELYVKGLQVVIVGERNHPEVIGIKGYTDGTAIVVESPSDAVNVKGFKYIGVVCQTTQNKANFDEIVQVLKDNNTKVTAFDTICSATNERQKSAHIVAEKVDLMILVGGKGSGNTKRLYEICKGLNKNTHWVETETELKKEWFSETKTVGLTAGASTPNWVINSVIKKAKSFS